MSEGLSKRVKIYALPVHLLDLDGDLTVHSTRDRAFQHYLHHWVKSEVQVDSLVERIDRSHLYLKERLCAKAAIYDGVIPDKDELDFQEFLELCEDVCHYEILEMEL